MPQSRRVYDCTPTGLSTVHIVSGFVAGQRLVHFKDGSTGTSIRARSSDTYRRVDELGRSTVHIEWCDGELRLFDADDLMVDADARGLSSLGIYGFDARGIKYLKAAARDGDFRPVGGYNWSVSPTTRTTATPSGYRPSAQERSLATSTRGWPDHSQRRSRLATICRPLSCADHHPAGCQDTSR